MINYPINLSNDIITTFTVKQKSYLHLVLLCYLFVYLFCYRGIIRNNSFWDKLVFRKVQEGMGGRLRLMVVGSAPLAANVLTFIRCSLGALVIMESSIYLYCSWFYSADAGTVS